MSDEEEKLLWWQIVLGALLSAPIIAPIVFLVGLPYLLYKAWVITILWKWFVMPVFSVPPLSLGYACGLLLIFYFLTASASGMRPKAKYSKEEAVSEAVWSFIWRTPTLKRKNPSNQPDLFEEARP